MCEISFIGSQIMIRSAQSVGTNKIKIQSVGMNKCLQLEKGGNSHPLKSK